MDVGQSADVVVVGGGIVGAATSYFLAQQGLRVALLEGRELAYGATGRNLGFIWMHTRKAGPELDLVLPTRRGLEELPEELGADFGLQCNGGLIFFNDERQIPVMQEFVAQRKSVGIPMSLLSGAEARELVPVLPESVLGATYCPQDAQVDPAAFVRAYAGAAARLGAEIHEGTPVRGMARENGRVTGVITDGGTINAGHVVLAAGGWTRELAVSAGIELPIHPMRLQIVQTQPMPKRVEHCVYGATAVKQYGVFQDLPSFDDNHFMNEVEWKHDMLLLESFCQKTDGSYLLGCAMDYPGFVWEPDLRGVALVNDVLMDHIPELRGAAFDRAWAGILPFTVDNLPIIDRAPGVEGLIVAAGHVFGNASGPTTGQLVAALITGSEPPISPDPFRAGRPGLHVAVEQSTW